MRFFVALLVAELTAKVAGDMCHDFCVSQIGAAACSRGSYCKNRFDCHGLFWTSLTDPRICVFGQAGCQNDRPVLCTEAAVALSVPGTSTTTALPATTPVPLTTTRMPVTTTTTRTRVSSGTGTRIEMHYDRTYDGGYPRVDVQFLAQEEPLTFSLLFDTGSPHTIIGQADRAARPQTPSSGAIRQARAGEWYIHTGATEIVRGRRTMHFGGEGSTARQVTIERRIREMAQLHSAADTFAHETLVDLTSTADAMVVCRGLFGAGRLSQFAEAAGVFGYLPHTGPASRGGAAGVLIVGDRDMARLQRENCAGGSPLFFTALDTHAGPGHWVIRGAVGLGDARGHAVSLVVDTGTLGFFVDGITYNQTVAAIQAVGNARVDPRFPGFNAIVRSCDDLRSYPDLHYMLGGAFRVTIPATEYMRATGRGDCELHLHLHRSQVLPATIVGSGILSKLFTVFDRENDRVGFCFKGPQ